jgi:hypothetical protein
MSPWRQSCLRSLADTPKLAGAYSILRANDLPLRVPGAGALLRADLQASALV